MAVAPDGVTVVAADPDRDRVYIIDLRTRGGDARTVDLSSHDEPGRVAVDSANRAHVALRNGGAIVTIDLATAMIIARRPACSAPRGIAYEPTTNVVHVACAGGELVTFPAGGGAATKRRFLRRDLRDVAVVPGGLMLSTFRDSRIFRLDNGSDVPVERVAERNIGFGAPRVAWRMISAPSPHDGGDDVVVSGQKVPDPDDNSPPAVPAPYYGSGECFTSGPGPVILDRAESILVPGAVLPVDVAATKHMMVIAAAGNGHTPSLPQLVFVGRLTPPSSSHEFSCVPGRGVPLNGLQITSVAFAKADSVVVALSREPAALSIVDLATGFEIERIPLAIESREDTGHAIFHSNSGAGVACASCHPDGRDDGHAWRSVELGPRRTPSLLGTLANTAPYHWNGEAKDMPALVRLTFESRMKGPVLAGDRIDAIGGWLQALRAPPSAKTSDPAAAARGKALFEGAAHCSTCHSGAMRTDNLSKNVQTGGLFQVPSLIGVAWRAPYFHDGSAPTLGAVLARGHSGASLAPQDRVDLGAYLETF